MQIYILLRLDLKFCRWRETPSNLKVLPILQIKLIFEIKLLLEMLLVSQTLSNEQN